MHSGQNPCFTGRRALNRGGECDKQILEQRAWKSGRVNSSHWQVNGPTTATADDRIGIVR